MNQLFRFIYLFRSLFLFLFLEFIAFFFIYRTSNYHGTRIFNSSNRLIAGVLSVSQNVSNFISLKDQNEVLIEENAALRDQLQKGELLQYMGEGSQLGSSKMNYSYRQAHVIDNSIYAANNFITIDKGAEQGIKDGQGVISSDGVVGIVRNAGSEYSVVYSLLHSKMNLSARLTRTNDIATVKWDGLDYRYGKLEYLAKHIPVVEGDTVVTSGFNAVFPKNIMVGIVDNVVREESKAFYDIRIRFSTNFSTLSHAYIIENESLKEIDSVTSEINTIDE